MPPCNHIYIYMYICNPSRCLAQQELLVAFKPPLWSVDSGEAERNSAPCEFKLNALNALHVLLTHAHIPSAQTEAEASLRWAFVWKRTSQSANFQFSATWPLPEASYIAWSPEVQVRPGASILRFWLLKAWMCPAPASSLSRKPTECTTIFKCSCKPASSLQMLQLVPCAIISEPSFCKVLCFVHLVYFQSSHAVCTWGSLVKFGLLRSM